MKHLTILVTGLFICSVAPAMAAEDHNSTRSNEGQSSVGQAASAPTDHNTTRSNRTAAPIADSDSESDSMYVGTPRDAASGMPTGKR